MKIDVVIFRILKYLYETSDEAMPSMEPIMPEALKISFDLWVNAIAILYENGYVKNVIVKYCKTGYVVLNEDEMKITLKGIEYYKNHTLLKRASDTMQDVKNIIPKI